MSQDQPTDARGRLLAHLEGTPASQHGPKWDDLWREGFLPWDKGFPNPALVDLLSERQDLFSSTPKIQGGKRLKALVPGCGKGYDVLLLSACGYDAYGLDVSNTALEAARETERQVQGSGREEYETREGVQRGTVRWVSGDFFGDEFLKDVEGGHEGFDLIYDYTVRSYIPSPSRNATE